MNKRRWICLLLAAEMGAVMLCAGGCGVKPGQGILYRIRGGRSEMYILGSIHVGNRDMQRFAPHIENAMEQSDVFVFECDTSGKEAREEIAAMQYSASPLSEKLKPETAQLLAQAAQTCGIPGAALENLQPWAAASLLTSAHAAKELQAGGTRRAQSMGVEETVSGYAEGKEKRYLETAVEQLSVLSGFSPELQEAMLQSSCNAILNPGDTNVEKWPVWWQSGDTESFVKAFEGENDFSSPELTEEYQRGLLTNRNKNMAFKLGGMLEEDGKTFFVTVGLYHLVLPEDSLLLELEKKGYTVERVTGE